jgi:hypothetical protein
MVAFLSFPDGEEFATGMAYYSYRPATQREILSRIIVNIRIEGISAAAIVDTGAPYVVCSPLIAKQIGLTAQTALERISLLVRGVVMRGYLHRLNVIFIAQQGADLDIDATVFVPDPEWEESWGDLPSFVGLIGCLERMRFAVDPGSDAFYFGPLA